MPPCFPFPDTRWMAFYYVPNERHGPILIALLESSPAAPFFTFLTKPTELWQSTTDHFWGKFALMKVHYLRYFLKSIAYWSPLLMIIACRDLGNGKRTWIAPLHRTNYATILGFPLYPQYVQGFKKLTLIFSQDAIKPPNNLKRMLGRCFISFGPALELSTFGKKFGELPTSLLNMRFLMIQPFFYYMSRTFQQKHKKKSILRHLLNAAKSCVPLHWKSTQPLTVSLWLHKRQDINEMEDLILTAQHKKYSKTWRLRNMFICSVEGESRI